MNFEHLCRIFVENYQRIANKTKAWNLIRFEYDVLRIKKERLKLGKVALEIKEYVMGEIVVFETLEMVFTRQDNTVENQLKIENRLKELDWKWNFDNIAAFILVITCLFIYTYGEIYDWFRDTYPALMCRDEKYDELLKFNFYCLYGMPELVKFETFQVPTYWVYEAICDLGIRLNIL